jgi:hypothetical protein
MVKLCGHCVFSCLVFYCLTHEQAQHEDCGCRLSVGHSRRQLRLGLRREGDEGRGGGPGGQSPRSEEKHPIHHNRRNTRSLVADPLPDRWMGTGDLQSGALRVTVVLPEDGGR